MKSFWKRMLVSSFMLIGFAGVSAERPPEKVVGGKVESVPVEIGRRYIGKVSAVNDVSLVARVNGTIQQQCFTNGDSVKKGQLLLVIEDTTYKAAVSSAKARLAQSEAELSRCNAELIRLKAEYEFARKDLDRQAKLWKSKAVSETVYDEAVRKEAVAKAAVASMESSIKSAEAAVEAAKAALVDAENNLSYTKIYAPFDGRAGRALVAPFNYVTPATGTLVYIADLSAMYVNFWITMRDYTALFGCDFERLKKEAHVVVTLADGRVLTGLKQEIVFVDNKVDKDTDTIRVRIKVTHLNNEHKEINGLLPDSLVSVRVSKKDPAKTAVPVSAIVTQGKQSFVYVVENNVAKIRPVQLGDIQGKMQIVTGGLKEGETIVVDGTHKVIFGMAAQNGQPVSL